MNKLRKIFFIILSIITIFSVEVFAKYNYKFTLNAYQFSRDNSEITYTLTKTVEENEYTNQDVTLTINLNKPVYQIDGFTISEDMKTLTKVITENETNTILVEDASGNTKEVIYNISNIDKIPPEIIGVEDGEIYTSNVVLDYKDNVGIKEVKIDKYGSLETSLHDDYYDTSFFKGTDLTDTTAQIRLVGHPKNTKSYKYYINNILKGETVENSYKFTDLEKGTSYTIKIEALDENGNVLETVTRDIKTKMFSKIEATKNNTGAFDVTVYGIDSSVDKAVAIGFTDASNHTTSYPAINDNRSVNVSFSAQAITGSLQSGYYYFHIQLYNNGVVVDTVCCNIIFNQTYTESTEDISQDLYNLTSDGNYQIVVTDLAENKTEKCITIEK